MKVYVYCLAESIDTLAEPLSGISGARVALVKVEGLSLLVSEFDGDLIPVTRNNALIHAGVVRSVLDRTTPLPFRFGTLVTEQQLKSFVSARRPALDNKLELVRDCVEMSVKIIWDSSSREEHESVVEPGRKQGPGAAFLLEKRREILGGELRAARAREVASWLEDQVGALIRVKQMSLCPTEKLLLAAAHLVERGSILSYRERLGDARRERPELHFLVSGPWPPYSFANIDLEFKTQFGVS